MLTSDIRIRLITDNRLADILLIDSRFRIVARGSSPLEASVPAGIYAAKVKIGDEETEELVSVRPDPGGVLEKRLEAPRFSSPIPLAKSSTTHEYHQAAAGKYLAPDAPRITRGAGSSVMLCVRDPSKTNFNVQGEELKAYARGFDGFRLLDPAGKLLVDFDKEADRELKDGYMAVRVDLVPGSYALAYVNSVSRLCVPLPTALGWTLQVYVQLLPASRPAQSMQPDFRDIALAYSREGAGFTPHSVSLEAIETVRKGLLEGRNYVDSETMSEFLTGKFEDPMLGLYAGHLLLLEKPLNERLMGLVIRNTAAMLGDTYPDLVGLAWGLQKCTGRPPAPPYDDIKGLLGRIAGPPLLARSWHLLVDAARTLDESLLSTAPVFAVAENLLAQGVYLTWMAKDEAAEDAVTSPRAHASTDKGRSGGMVEPVLANLASRVGKAFGNLVYGMRGKLTATLAGPPPVEDLRTIKSAEEAAAAMLWLARSYDWNTIVPDLKRNPKAIANLSGLQRDLFQTMRSACQDKSSLEGLTPQFVQSLLDSYQVPVQTLGAALAGLEAGGYLAGKIKLLLSNKPAVRSARPQQFS